jgi:S-adenosylmethionine uptake transporter
MSENSLVAVPQQVAVMPDLSLRGIALVAFGISIFSIQDVLIRHLSGGYSVVEIMFIRALVALGPMYFFVHIDGGFRSLKSKHPALQALRGLLGVFSYTAYYMAMASLPLATVTSIFFVSPLIVTLFSVVFLREAVGLRRWAGVLIGFAGMLVIVQPGRGPLDWAALLPIVAALTYAGSIMLTRKLGRTETGASLAFYAMVTFMAASGGAGFLFGDGALANEAHPSTAFLLRAWQLPNLADLCIIAVCGFVAAVGFYCLSQGYRLAQASVAAPFEYVALPLSIAWGYFMWDEVPTASTFLGIAMIVAGGLYVLRRETQRKRQLITGRGVRLRL